MKKRTSIDAAIQRAVTGVVKEELAPVLSELAFIRSQLALTAKALDTLLEMAKLDEEQHEVAESEAASAPT